MAEFPPSPQNYESDENEGINTKEEGEEEEEISRQPVNNNVANILARLQSSGALIKKPKQEFYCFTCGLDLLDWASLENHLIQHVSLPSVVIDRLPSDDEDSPPSGDEKWSDEEEQETSRPQAQTSQKIDISQILKTKGLSIKKVNEDESKSSSSALSKLSGLGFTIKGSTTPVKKEKPENDTQNNDVMQRLGKLGGIKLKLKSDGGNTNSFKVVNGLKDFKTSDEDDDVSDEDKEDFNEDIEENDESRAESEEHHVFPNKQVTNSSRKPSESDDSDASSKTSEVSKTRQRIATPKKIETVLKNTLAKVQQVQKRPRGRPAVKQTPKRGADISPSVKEIPRNPEINESRRSSMASTPEIQESHDQSESVNVKKEIVDTNDESPPSSTPLFSGPVKTERMSPTPQLPDSSSTPMVTKVKVENDTTTTSTSSNAAMPLLSVTKTEEISAVIEINGDSADEDDDCCVVSTTPAPDIKPKIEPVAPKIETVSTPGYSSSTAFSMPSTNYSTASITSPRTQSIPSMEKQHSFNWNAPDSKQSIDVVEKSADDIFESLLSTSSKKESMLSDANEYISLDKLGSQHTCDVCNTRFTDLSLLEEHRRMTGHSQSLALPSSSSVVPYTPSPNILSSLLPVKQIAEQVGKLSTIGSNGPGYTHQQNVMINIQAYPGAGGVMMPPQTPYNAYPNSQNMHANYPPTSNMYGSTGNNMPGQYPNTNYMASSMPGYNNQYQPQMSKAGYSGTMPQSTYTTSSPFSGSSPLQSMQQSVYGQASMMNQQPGAMGPPSSPSQPYVPVSSPGGMMKPASNSGIKIQNIQTFGPGQLVGGPTVSVAPGHDMGMTSTGQNVVQMPPPTQITMAPNATTGPRPRMAGVRGQRPTLRPGIQVHNQVRGGKVQPMGIKRQGGQIGGPGQKRRADMFSGKHDNEDCQVMAMQKQREGMPLIQSVQGAKDRLNIGSQISVTKKTVNKEANAMANVLASRGISVKQKQKSRSPSPERPIPHIPNLGSGVSIKHTSKPSNFSIPEAKVGGGMIACKICKKLCMNQNSLQKHMTNIHPQSKLNVFKCDECPASYHKSLQLQHHKRVFHNVSGANKELGLPVVDFSQPENLKRLGNLGIYSFIPLANREQANGCFGIPLISAHNMQSSLASSLQALGADGLLSLGPLKPVPN